MSEAEPVRVSVRILDKDYHVACPPDEKEDLLRSAAFLNTRMREIRDSGKVVGTDRIAVLAALNTANELLKLKSRADREAAVGVRLKQMRDKVESALERGQQLEL